MVKSDTHQTVGTNPRMLINIRSSTSSSLGGRATQQDQHSIVENLFGSCFLFAVFDGHGSDGRRCSEWCKTQLPLEIANSDFLIDPINSLKLAFKSCNSKMLENPAIDSYMSGTTASVCIFHNNLLYTANGILFLI